MPRRLGASLTGAVAAALLLVGCRAPAPPRTPPSIVVITVDTLRADHLSAASMPTLDALGREGVVFEQALTVAPLTLPAHASLLSGLYPPGHRVRDNEVSALPADIPTYPARFKERGYATGAFVSAVVLDRRYGLDRGFEVYDAEIAGPERSAADTISRAQRWIDSAPRPFFVWLHLFEPHAPYRTGSYAGEVSAVDAEIGKFFGHLRAGQLWDNTIVSVTADHGESLGEHGEQTHGFFLYDATLRIPWVLKAPGLSPDRVPQLVRIVDEMPTIADLAGIVDPAEIAPKRDGVSVVPALRGESLGLEAYSETFLPFDQFGWSALTSLRTDRFKYVDAPQRELYDLTRDPGERSNIASGSTTDVSRLKRILDAIGRAPAPPSGHTASDPALSEKLLSLGYIGHSRRQADAAGNTLPDPKSKIEVYNLTMSALELSETGDVAGALNALQKAGRLDPDVPQIAFLEGTVLGRAGRFEQAVTALQRTLALDPQHTAARFKLALAWLRLGRTERATEALQEVTRQQPDDFRAWHNLAAIAYTRGDLDGAEALEQKAIAIAPEYSEAWNTLGAIALIRKRTDAALEALTKATRFGPQNAQAFDNLAMALTAAGQPDRARAASERACALNATLCRGRERP